MVMRNKKKIFGNVQTLSYSDYIYTGLKTETAEVIINQLTKEISVNVDLDNYYTKQETIDLMPTIEQFISNIPQEYVTETELVDKGYIDEETLWMILNNITCIDGGIVE